MKLITHYLESIEGVAIYQIIPLILFFIFFLVIILYTLRIRKEDIKSFSNIPFEGDEESGNEKPNN
jgi:hypothetical protein